MISRLASTTPLLQPFAALRSPSLLSIVVTFSMHDDSTENSKISLLMFECSICGKVYKTRTSLTRHTHNHNAATTQHTCTTCGVSFARRDILSRHVNNGHCSVSNKGRPRCHTACEPCRAARIKCDGISPCRTCRLARRECTYPSSTGRISQPTRVSHANFSQHDDEITPTSSSDRLPPDGDSHHRPSSRDGHSSTEADGDLNDRPWPWLHEDLFMRRGAKNGRQRAAESSTQPPNLPHSNSVQRSTSITASERSNSIFSAASPLSYVIETLAAYGANTAFTPEEMLTRRRYWESVSLQLAEIFCESESQPYPEPHRTLHHLVEIYLAKFNVLWPLLNHEHLNPDTHHPVLFLTVSSIGAMFGNRSQRQYGTMMHERLRRLLSASLYDLEGPEDGLVWLAQARLITQVASLYFGQNQGFSYAQHLNAITIAQLRRMDYFRESYPNGCPRIKMAPEAELQHWQFAEVRRRLAFGILRTDVYTSVLLATRPIMTAEELKMGFPRSDELWLNKKNLSPEGRIWAQRVEDSQALPMPFSDLIRIFFERNEANPDLSPVQRELVLFGMQEAVWRFSQDPQLFLRMTGQSLDAVDFGARGEQGDGVARSEKDEAEHGRYRQMEGLHNERARLLQALDAWYYDFDRAIASNAYAQYKDTLMSSLLLYHLSRLRLYAPLEDLHQISYRVTEPKSIQLQTLQKVRTWAKSLYASEAARQAWDVKNLIEQELQKPREAQARFNFLAFASLHHSTVVLWTVADSAEDAESMQMDEERFALPKNEIEDFLQGCPHVFSRLSPLGGNSFEAAAHRLSRYRFPRNLQTRVGG